MFDAKRLVKRIRERKAKRVLLQVPEGLKMRVTEIAEELSASGAEIVVSVEPCYGACDVRDRDAEFLGCDLLVHIGHSDYGVRTKVPVIYEEYRMEFDPVTVLEKSMEKLEGFERIGLTASVQYLGGLEKARRFLESRGKTVLVGRPEKAKHEGQILGCDFSAAKSIESRVECFLYIGSGRFHPLGLALSTERPVFAVGPESGDMQDLSEERDRQERIRLAQIEKAKDAKKFGILVSTKPGQMRIEAAASAKKKLEASGRRAWILSGDEITPEKLMGIDVEVLVNTACPRIREDWKLFGKTIIDVGDVENIIAHESIESPREDA